MWNSTAREMQYTKQKSIMPLTAAHPSLFASIGVIALVLWRVYARIRRVIGRQTLKRRRVMIPVIVLPIALVVLLLASISNPLSAVSLCVGATIGSLLGVYGLRLTRFEVTEAGYFYTPNAHLGVALSLLFAGRLAYRFLHLQIIGDATVAPPMDFTRSPLTLLIFATLIGYYLAYAIGLLRWSANTPQPVAGVAMPASQGESATHAADTPRDSGAP